MRKIGQAGEVLAVPAGSVQSGSVLDEAPALDGEARVALPGAGRGGREGDGLGDVLDAVNSHGDDRVTGLDRLREDRICGHGEPFGEVKTYMIQDECVPTNCGSNVPLRNKKIM